MRPDLAQLAALDAVAREGTFEAAARALSVTPSAVSQRIRALETAVGRVVVQRTKPVLVTEAGATLIRLSRQLDLLLHDVELELGTGADNARTPIALATNSDSLATWLLPSLAPLAADIDLDLRTDDQEHTAALLRDGSVVGAITALAAPVAGCESVRLGSMRYRAMCSPAFAAEWFGGGASTEGLSRAPVVVFDRKDELQDAWLARRAGHPLSPPRHHVPASTQFVDAVALGFGWGMVPDLQGDGLRADGLLVELAPAATVDVPLYWQHWAFDTALLRQVGGAIVTGARERLR